MTLVFAVLAGYGAALLAPTLGARAPRTTGWLVALVPLALVLYFASLLPAIAAGEAPRVVLAWAPELGVSLSFRVDGLSLLFALLISGIGVLVVIYASGYLAGDRQIGRFYAFLLMFMASMLGVVLADNLIALFVFWELTSLASYLLIGYEHDQARARAAATQALLVTGGGGLAMLAGVILLAQIGGSYELSELFGRGDVVRAHPFYGAMLVLLLIGAFTKSAQFPFHFWLPAAMEAPTPVSAYLHSATMVKAGVYLLARVSPIVGDTVPWHVLVSVVGAATLLVGGFLALTESDLKRVLAYSTVSALGTLVLLLGIGTPGAIAAAVVFLLAHALYKGALFMVAGSVYHETGTRDAAVLGGLRHEMPITAIVAALAAISLAGVGPVLSFIGKEMLLEAVLHETGFLFLLRPVAVLGGAFFVAAAGIVAIRPFFGRPRPTPRPPHEAPPTMLLGPILLAGLGILFGIAPGLMADLVIAPTVAAVAGEPIQVELELWHGLNLPLALSVVSLALGIVLFLLWDRLRDAWATWDSLSRWGPAGIYQRSLPGLASLSRGTVAIVQSGYIRVYLLVVIAVTVGLVGMTLVARAALPVPAQLTEVRFYDVVIALLILLAAATAIRARSRLAAVTALGVVGYGIALIYIFFGAPDLAMTQILVETLTVILYVLVLYHLPPFARLSKRSTRARDAAVALAGGLLMAALVVAATSVPRTTRDSEYFAAGSYVLAHGRNVVNVILVDFRALDTLGEITVLSLAAVGVYALLRLRPHHPEDARVIPDPD